MQGRTISNVKLGAFVLAGLLFLVLLLYMIGKNRNLFGANYMLKARFEHVQGLVAGNNVRYSGIEAGTVKKIHILNDTLIEVTMSITKKMQGIIRKNAIVSIGTEGFVGNKVVNILPSRQPDGLAEEGDVLITKKTVDTDEILQTLSRTSHDIAVIASGLKETVQRVNNSQALWSLLNDQELPKDLKASVSRIRQATGKAEHMAENLDAVITDLKGGKGLAGKILTDTSLANNLNETMLKIKQVGMEADALVAELGKVAGTISADVNRGKGPLSVLLRDSALVIKLNTSLDNIEKGTEGFNQNMEALKHNFLLRGYFKKQEKKKRKEEAGSTAKDH